MNFPLKKKENSICEIANLKNVNEQQLQKIIHLESESRICKQLLQTKHQEIETVSLKIQSLTDVVSKSKAAQSNMPLQKSTSRSPMKPKPARGYFPFHENQEPVSKP